MKKTLLQVAAVLLGVAVGLLLFELFLRLNPGFGYTQIFYKQNSPGLQQFLVRKRHSELVGYENIPNADGMNAYGLISREHKLKKDSGVFRILILGDSVAEGLDNDFFERELNQKYLADTGYTFEVWNGATGGYDIRRYYLYLRYKGIHFDPDIVCIFLCLNDFELDTSLYYKDKDGATIYDFHLCSAFFSTHLPNPFLMHRFHLYRFVVLRLNDYLIKREEKKIYVNPRLQQARSYITMINDLCRQRNLPLWAVIYPYLKPMTEYTDFERRQYEDIKKALEDTGIVFFDLHDYLTPERLRSFRARSDGQMHPHHDDHHYLTGIISKGFADRFHFLQNHP